LPAADFLRKLNNKRYEWQSRLRRLWISISSDPRPTSYPYISGDSFRALADHVLDETNPMIDPGEVTAGQVLFVSTYYLSLFFDRVRPGIRVPYKLITHNADLPVDESRLQYIDERMLAWFALNNKVVHPKVVPMPIGLENKYLQANGRTAVFNRIRNEIVQQEKLNRIAFGFSIRTNEVERRPAFQYLTHHPLCDELKRMPNPAYLRRLAGYKFLAAPPGNGIDTHRVWEALYLHVVPIVKRSPAMTYFENLGLPIWQIEDWCELDRVDSRVLGDRYVDMSNKFEASPLFMDYWMRRLSGVGE
jgi:hypothetical protein